MGVEVAGGRIVAIEVHPEFERYQLEDPAGRRLVVEVAIDDGVHRGLCSFGGTTLFPRYELLEGEPPELRPEELCAALEHDPPRLRSVAVAAQPTLPPVVEEAAVQARSLATRLAVGLLALVAAIAGLLALRPTRGRCLGVLGAMGAAFLGWWAAGPPSTFNGNGANWEKLVIAWGLEHQCPYGEGWPVLMAPAVAWLGHSPEAVFATNALLHVLSGGLVWLLAAGELGGVRLGPWVAALAWALLPVPARLGASEAMHVAAGFLLLAALTAASAWRRNGGRAAGIAAAAFGGLALHTRPELLPLALLLPLWAWPRRGWLPAGIFALALAGRVASMGGQSVLDFGRFADPGVLFALLRPHLPPATEAPAFQLFWHGAFTPMILWPLALWGAWRAEPRLRLRLAAWILLLGFPVALKAWPLADAMRLQAPVLPAWCLLLAAAPAPTALRAAVLVLALFRPALPRWPDSREFDFLRATVPGLGERDIAFESSHVRAEKFRIVMQALGPARWGEEGELRYVGLRCFLDAEGEACKKEGCPVATTTLPPESDLDLHLAGPVEIGFWGPCR